MESKPGEENIGNVTSLGNFRKHKEEQQELKCESCNTPLADDEELIFVCTNCNCRTWRLKASGAIECSSCDNEVHPDEKDPADAGWRRIVDSAPKDKDEIAALPDDAGTINKHDYGDVSLARRRVLKIAQEASKDNTLAFLGMYEEDGAGNWWMNLQSAERRDDIVKKIREMADHLEKMVFEEEEEEHD